MSICCFPNCAYLSETSRMLAVYKKLVERGADVIMATHGGTYEFVLKDEGIPFKLVEPRMSKERAQEYVATNRGERGTQGFYKTDELREHVHSEIQFFKENNVSVVLTGWTLSTALSTRAAGIPYAVTHLGSWAPPVFERKMQPWPPELENPITRLMPESWKISLTNWMFLRFKMFMKSENIIAKELHINPFKSFSDLMMGDLTLVTDVPEILTIPADEMNNWTPQKPELYSRTPRLQYVGPIFAKLFGDIPEDVKTFLNTKQPKVYVALTSSRPDYISTVYSTLQTMDVKAVFCSTIHATQFEKSPNILLKEHLPSHQVMPLVDLAIIHGGQGSVQTAIASGAPLIGFSLQAEQRFNLKMIERHGAGIWLSPGFLKKGDLRAQIEKVLTNNSFKTNMQRLQAFQNRADGAENAAIALQELAQGEK